jgi:hypothetical protein
VLRVVSPGTYAFHDQTLLVRPLTAGSRSASAADTLRGLAFLAAFALLAIAVQLELADGRWRRRLMRTVVWTGARPHDRRAPAGRLARTEKALRRLAADLGLGVFGPYVNRNHFAAIW